MIERVGGAIPVDPVHRAYADVFLRPMLGKIRVYIFERT